MTDRDLPVCPHCGVPLGEQHFAEMHPDPDGPLVPLSLRTPPARVVPEFPLSAYRVLVEG